MWSSDHRYKAFISYSHGDRACAAWLHRAIESYRLPSKLVGTATAIGPVPQRLAPIFKDRDELAAAGDLGAELRQALAASQFLIVVCSRAAARSPWVDREIRTFKMSHADMFVLAVIADGEPFASRLPGRESEECFPPALRFQVDPSGQLTAEPAEPIAADLRPGGDGRRLTRLKLAAGLAGVSLDQLVQREAQRRTHRASLTATAASLLAMIMTALTLVAVDARRDAEQRRDQAEGLVEYMLGDLRQKLEPVGRLEVLDGVGERAIAYYAEQDADELDADALGRRSRALHLIGEVRNLRGDTKGALEVFHQASETTAELLARAPDDDQRVFDHAQSIFWVGFVAWQRGEAKRAERAFVSYGDLARRLVNLDPTREDWQAEIGYANSNLGTLLLEQGRAAEALKAFETAHAALNRLDRNKREYVIELASIEGWIAKSHEHLGAIGAALAARHRQLALFRAMRGGTDDMEAQEGIGVGVTEIGRLELARGGIAASLVRCAEGTRLWRRLIETDRTNTRWREQAAMAELRFTEALAAAGRLDEARARLVAADHLIAALLQADSAVVLWQINLRGRAELIAARLARPEQRGERLQSLGRFLAQAEGLRQAGRIDDDEKLALLGGAYLAQGDLLAAEGAAAKAAASWQRAATLLAPFEHRSYAIGATRLAAAWLRLGDADGAQRIIASQVWQTDYRSPEFAALIDRLPGSVRRLASQPRWRSRHAERQHQRRQRKLRQLQSRPTQPERCRSQSDDPVHAADAGL